MNHKSVDFEQLTPMMQHYVQTERMQIRTVFYSIVLAIFTKCSLKMRKLYQKNWN